MRFFVPGEPTVIGEMAHIIAASPRGPRGTLNGGDNTYHNLILLCPTDHTKIDKAPPGVYPTDTILEWKRAHEDRVSASFQSPVFPDRRDLAKDIKRLLVRNRQIWTNYGPESAEAESNPISSLSEFWKLRRLSEIVPNNRRIINMLKRNETLFELRDAESVAKFVEHAEGFEMSCYSRTEGVPRFPSEFEEVVDRYVSEK